MCGSTSIRVICQLPVAYCPFRSKLTNLLCLVPCTLSLYNASAKPYFPASIQELPESIV